MTETKEMWVSDEPLEAARKARRTLERVGELTKVDPGVCLEGRIAFGVQSSTVRITWRPEEAAAKVPVVAGSERLPSQALLGTMLNVEAESEKTQVAAKSAIERFEEAYFHFGDPAYQPDRLGVLPVTIIAIFLVLMLLGVMLWHNPAFRRLLPVVPGHASIQASIPPPADATPDPGAPAAAQGQ